MKSSPEIRKFIEREGDIVIGTYLYPYCLLTKPNYNDPLSTTKVIQQIDTDHGKILVTLNGGLFIQPSAELAHSDPSNEQAWRKRISFKEIIRIIPRYPRTFLGFQIDGFVAECGDIKDHGYFRIYDRFHLPIIYRCLLP